MIKITPGIASIQSCGTRTVRMMFKPEHCRSVQTQHFGLGHLHVLKGLYIITPIRRLSSLIRSWVRRGDDLERLHGAIGEMVEYPTDFHLPLDSDERDNRLQELSGIAGVELKTDWYPQGCTDKGSNTDFNHEWSDKIHTDFDPFFEKFYRA